MSIAPLEIYLLRKLVTYSILALSFTCCMKRYAVFGCDCLHYLTKVLIKRNDSNISHPLEKE